MSTKPPPAPEERRSDAPKTLWGWFWLNFGPFIPILLAALAIFDTARAAQWAAFAAAIAGLTGGGKLPPVLNGQFPKPPTPPTSNGHEK